MPGKRRRRYDSLSISERYTARPYQASTCYCDSAGLRVMEIPVRMRQTRMRPVRWESPPGFKCQTRSTRMVKLGGVVCCMGSLSPIPGPLRKRRRLTTPVALEIFMRAFLAVLLCFLVGPSWAAEAIVTDGDTLILNGTAYRLDGIDAPETDQICINEKGGVWACGIEARDQLRKFIGKREVRCDSRGYDTLYRNRRIGVCRVEGDATSLNEWLVKNGWALNFEPYAKGRFNANEEEARKNGLGLWKGCFSRPQEARRWNKRMATLLGEACTMSENRSVRDKLFPNHPAMPPGCTIKGKLAVRANVTGHRGIYHLENCRSYLRTKGPDRWFCTEDEAQAEGFRKALTC